jgi:hypothetical protein
MSDSYGEPQQQGAQGDGSRGDGHRGEGGRGGGRGGRGPGNREGGGFRIRLSENEMRSARALQEAFNLRSTVAVLGFALRTLGQMLEDGQLDELIEQQRNQAPRGRREGGGRDGGGRGRRSDDDPQGGRGSRPDPFARPAKPQPEPEPTPEPESTPEEATPSDAPAEDTPAEASTDLPNEEESKAATPEA